ncbi:unnamed protein product [Rotaria sordida]|uniref:Uncharacterized protein n=1 Tax=Rotaria sordida TaxID=392033 RepID=A0A820F1S8_9BILA|nr:unnamed protein product [Rotaria sordida]CAF3916672.1 unnamed protein product [Rotaria sordida]CAF4256985.1 unnamed protein product [Rotaria sordida]
MEACMSDIPDCKWLAQWQELVKHFAFQFNPTFTSKTNYYLWLYIKKTTSDGEIKTLLHIFVKTLESFSHINSIIMCLTRLLSLLSPESKIHKFIL